MKNGKHEKNVDNLSESVFLVYAIDVCSPVYVFPEFFSFIKLVGIVNKS